MIGTQGNDAPTEEKTMTNLLDTLQATQSFASEFIAQPSQETYDRMLATAAVHIREDLEEHPNATFHGVAMSLIDKLPVLPFGPMDFDLTGKVSSMLTVLKFSRNPAAATFSQWNPRGEVDLATDLFYLAAYALAEDIRQAIVIS
jgi:hypothetical protein